MTRPGKRAARGGHPDYLLSAYLFGDISESGKREVEGHLAACAACQAEVQELRQVVGAAEDAFAAEGQGAGVLPGQGPRLGRVLAEARRKSPGGTSSFKWAWAVGLAAAAVMAIGFTLPVLITGRSTLPQRWRVEGPAASAPAGTIGGYADSETEPMKVDAPVALLQGSMDPVANEPVPTRHFAEAIPATPSPPAVQELARGDGGGRAGARARRAGQTSDAPPPALEKWAAAGREVPGVDGNIADSTRDDMIEFSDSMNSRAAESLKQKRRELGRQEEAIPADGDRMAAKGSPPREELERANKKLAGNARLPENEIADKLGTLTADREYKAGEKYDLAFEPAKPYSREEAEVRVESRFLQEDLLEEIQKDAKKVNYYLKLPERRAAEDRIRAFHYYRALDPNLTSDAFSARKLEVPPPALGDEGLGAEGFRARYGVHPFVDTRRDHFSTFGMDVDTASYTLARKALGEGRLPDPAQVRVEEFVNYFREDVPATRDEVFSVHSEGGPSPFGEGLDLLKIAVKARDLLPGERKDAVLTFAVDTSGSMHHGDRLELVRQSLAVLAGALGPDDRVAIVAFNDHPYLVLPHTAARDANRILGAIASLAPGGDTNFEAGLDLAYRIADEVFETRAIHRVVLCSDGVATAGARGPEEILRKVEVFARRGIYLSCVGFGMGKYNDRLLETLADKGNGNYAYVDGAAAAAQVFKSNLPSTLQVLAADAKIQVEFAPEVVSHYRLLGYENRDIADRDFRNDQVDAGEVGPGSTVTVLYEVLRRTGSSGDIGRLRIRYRDAGTGRVEERDYPLSPGMVATRIEETSDRFRFIACAAEMAELLRGSYWARNGSQGRVLSALQAMSHEYRARPEWRELAALAARAQEITIKSLAGQ